MSDLIVSSIENELVVDSRLIAQELGVTHEATMKTIEKYATELQGFGHLRFEIGTVTNSVGARNQVRFAYLNENQSTLLMSLSRNTAQVIALKVRLVAAFSAAKSEIIKPKTALELAKEQVKLLEALELKDKQIAMLQEATERQAEVIDELFDYSSIIRIAKYNGCDEKAFSWYKLKVASQTLGIEIKKAPCPRYGEKNLYSHDAWRLAYPGYRLPETLTLTLSELFE